MLDRLRIYQFCKISADYFCFKNIKIKTRARRNPAEKPSKFIHGVTPKLSKNDVCSSYGFDSNFLLGNPTQILDHWDLGSFLLSKNKILS
jgi:hypothetical protein